MRDNIIYVNFTAKQKRKTKVKNYIFGKFQIFKSYFLIKSKRLDEPKSDKDYHKFTM